MEKQIKFKVGDWVQFDPTSKVTPNSAANIFKDKYQIISFGTNPEICNLSGDPGNCWDIRRFKLANSHIIRERLGIK